MARMLGIEQQSPQWIIARIGCVTASRAGDVCKKLKRTNGEAKARENYRMEKVIETLMGRAADHPVNQAMIWGSDTQPLCRTEYELRNGIFVEEGGFWMHDKISKFRASPDYLVGSDGLLECKCPFNTDNHLAIYMNREVPEAYLWQIMAQLAVTNRKWCDFVSFDPRVPQEHLQMAVIRVPRDEALIAAVEVEVNQFLEEVAQTIKFLGADSKAPADEKDVRPRVAV